MSQEGVEARRADEARTLILVREPLKRFAQENRKRKDEGAGGSALPQRSQVLRVSRTGVRMNERECSGYFPAKRVIVSKNRRFHQTVGLAPNVHAHSARPRRVGGQADAREYDAGIDSMRNQLSRSTNASAESIARSCSRVLSRIQ